MNLFRSSALAAYYDFIQNRRREILDFYVPGQDMMTLMMGDRNTFHYLNYALEDENFVMVKSAGECFVFIKRILKDGYGY